MDDNVMINGWLEATSLRLVTWRTSLKKGLEYICCTDIRTDGTLQALT